MLSKTQEDEVICSVLSVLIDTFVSSKTSIPTEEGMSCLTAVIVLLKKVKLSQGVLDSVAGRFLEIFQKSKKRFFSNKEALGAAIRVTELGVSSGMTERIVHEALKNGWLWICNDDNLAEKLLKRKLKSEEVVWLIDHYVRDKVCQCDATEKILATLAWKYVDNAFNQIERLEKFKVEFSRDDGY